MQAWVAKFVSGLCFSTIFAAAEKIAASAALLSVIIGNSSASSVPKLPDAVPYLFTIFRTTRISLHAFGWLPLHLTDAIEAGADDRQPNPRRRCNNMVRVSESYARSNCGRRAKCHLFASATMRKRPSRFATCGCARPNCPSPHRCRWPGARARPGGCPLRHP